MRLPVGGATIAPPPPLFHTVVPAAVDMKLPSVPAAATALPITAASPLGSPATHNAAMSVASTVESVTSAVSLGADGRPIKRRRKTGPKKKFPRHQVAQLEAVYERAPHPSAETIVALATELGDTVARVRILGTSVGVHRVHVAHRVLCFCLR